MNKDKKELYIDVVYDAYTRIIPALVWNIGEKKFILHDIESYFIMGNESIDRKLLGTYLYAPNVIIIYLDNIYNASELLMRLRLKFDERTREEISTIRYSRTIAMNSIITKVIIHELLLYNQYKEFGENGDYIAENMVRSETLRFMLEHYYEIKDLLDIYDECIIELMHEELITTILKKTNSSTVDEILKYAIKNTDEVVRENAKLNKYEFVEYKHIDSLNYLSKLIYGIYKSQMLNKEHLKSKNIRFNDENELMQFINKFNEDYKRIRSVKFEFDIEIPTTDKRVSRYVLLKSNGIEHDEVLSIERAFHDIRKPLEKKMHINSKRLNNMNNKKLYSALTGWETFPGLLVALDIFIDYIISNDEMIIYIKNL